MQLNENNNNNNNTSKCNNNDKVNCLFLRTARVSFGKKKQLTSKSIFRVSRGVVYLRYHNCSFTDVLSKKIIVLLFCRRRSDTIRSGLLFGISDTSRLFSKRLLHVFSKRKIESTARRSKCSRERSLCPERNIYRVFLPSTIETIK